MNSIIAVDPGHTTGWAHQWPSGDAFAGELAGPEVFMLSLKDWMTTAGRGVLVMEDFKPRPGVSWQPDALHIIGFGRGTACSLGFEFVLQPTSIKKFATDAKLKRAGWWMPGMGHANDALRHLLFYRCTVLRDEDLIRKVAA